MKYELFPIRAKKVSVDDDNTVVRFADKDDEEIMIIIPAPTYGLFYHNKKYKLTIEEITEEPTQSDAN
jgi:hypothetical protein